MVVVCNVNGIVSQNETAGESSAVLKPIEVTKEVESEFIDAPDIDGLVDESITKVESEKEAVGLKKLEEFETKDELEAYGLELGIDLKKNKKIENMYADLVEFASK